MNFEDAVACLKKGERIKRGHWKSAYLVMDKGKVKMRMGFRKPWFYQFRNDDIGSNDWLIHINPMMDEEEEAYGERKHLTGYLSYGINY